MNYGGQEAKRGHEGRGYGCGDGAAWRGLSPPTARLRVQ